MGKEKLVFKLHEVYLITMQDGDGDDTISEVKIISVSPSGKFAKVEYVNEKEEPFWLNIDETEILEQIS